jgi:hypothetical protein
VQLFNGLKHIQEKMKMNLNAKNPIAVTLSVDTKAAITNATMRKMGMIMIDES